MDQRITSNQRPGLRINLLLAARLLACIDMPNQADLPYKVIPRLTKIS